MSPLKLKDLLVVTFIGKQTTEPEREILLFDDGPVRVPMIGDEERIKSLLPLAQEISKSTGKQIGISRYVFSKDESIAEILGGTNNDPTGKDQGQRTDPHLP